MLCKNHLCTFMEEIFIINLYGTEDEKKILEDFLSLKDGNSLKKIIYIADIIKKKRG